jgi:hypothetical protein
VRVREAAVPAVHKLKLLCSEFDGVPPMTSASGDSFSGDVFCRAGDRSDASRASRSDGSSWEKSPYRSTPQSWGRASMV